MLTLRNMVDPQIARIAEAVAQAYARDVLLPAETKFVRLRVYFDGDASYQLAPPLLAYARLWGDAEELDDSNGQDAEELDDPNVGDVPEIEALLGRINDDEEELLGEYFDELVVRMHAVLGVFAFYDGLDWSFGSGVRAQLERQLTPEERAEWAANDRLPRDRRGDALLERLDVVISMRLDPDRVAAVYRKDGMLYGSAYLTDIRFGRELTGSAQTIGNEPAHVLAGLLPEGAVSAAVQDLFDVWHDAAVGGGAWLCALPHPERGGAPPIIFRDGAGAAVTVARGSRFPDEEVVLMLGVEGDGEPLDEAAWRAEQAAELRRDLVASGMPVLWPVGVPSPPRVVDATPPGRWSEGAARLELGAIEVTIQGRVQGEQNFGPAERLLENALRSTLGERRAARAVLEAPRTRIPGSIGNTRTRWAMVAAGGRWAAVYDRDDPLVSVVGEGEAPTRLDMDLIDPDTVQG